jgi:HEAT repeat protein
MPRASLVIFVLAVLAAAPPMAAAQRRPPRRPPAAPTGEPLAAAPTLADLATIVPKLESANADEVREAIDLLTVIDRPEVVPPLAALLRSGQPDAITDRTIEALGGLAQASAVDVLVEFTHHRREGARRRAYQSLASIQDPRVPRLLEIGLRDSDRGVRGAAALALGDIGARGSVDTLFIAFDRGVIEAAIAIGKLGDPAAVNKFSESIGRRPLSVMLSGFEQFVRRRDITDEVKLQIVQRLGEIAGPLVKTFLRDYLGTFSERDRSGLKRAVEENIRRIPDAPAGAPAAAAAPSQPAPAASPAGGAQ